MALNGGDPKMLYENGVTSPPR